MVSLRKIFVILGFLAFLAIPCLALAQSGDLREADALQQKVAQLFQAGRYQEALPMAHRALEIREKALGPEHPDTAATLNNLALLYQAMGVYDQALPLFQRALKIQVKVLGPEHAEIATTLNNLAEIYHSMGIYEQSLNMHQRALKIREKVLGPEHPQTALSLNNLAVLYWTMGVYERALPLSQRALMIRERRLGPDHPDSANSLNNLAKIYQHMGIYDQALLFYQRSLKICEKNLGPEHHHTATIINNMALLFGDMGSYDKAFTLHQQALKIREKSLGPEHFETTNSLINLAALYKAMGAFHQALPLYQRSLKIREKILGPDHPAIATNIINIGTLYYSMEAYDQALPLFERALKITTKALGPQHPNTVTCLVSLGSLHLVKKDYTRAEEYFRQGYSRVGLVDLYLATGQAPVALNLIINQEPPLKAPSSYHILYHTHHGLALTGVGRRGEAVVALDRAVQEIEQVRRRFREPVAGFFQAGFSGGYLRSYRGLVAALAEMAIRGEPLPSELQSYGPDPGAAAFAVAEATKGRVLLESMAKAARRQIRVDIPPELRQREEKLLHQMASLEAQWEKAMVGGEEALKEVKTRQERLTGEFQALVRELRQQHPLYAALHYPQPLPARELPLKPGEVLLEYALGEKESYLFRVEPGGKTQVFRLALGQEALEKRLSALLAPFRQSVLRREDLERFSLSEAASLYRELLEPALAGVAPGTRLIIVPDGILGAFPFEALVVQAGPDWAKSVLAGDRWPLTYSQSAAILALNRHLQLSQAPQPLFALGDCIYEKGSPRYQAYKAGRGMAGELKHIGPEKALTISATRQEWGRLHFQPLPETRKTVKDLAGLFKVPPKAPQVLLDVNATETRVRQAPLGQYRYLFFGTHGFLADKMSGVQEPTLVLTQVENKPPDDGFLTFSKVLQLKLDAEVVTLAACMTGVGQVMQGEGVLNFARAFQQAGARSVMVALWNIPVDESLMFYHTFYQGLKEGKTRLQALQGARQAVRAKEPHPYFWSGLILHGEG